MLTTAQIRNAGGAVKKFRCGILRISPSTTAAESKRSQTTFNAYNKSANIRNVRYRDPAITDLCTPWMMNPRLPESIQPLEMRYPMEAPPWPYKEKGYRWYHRMIDTTTKRFDENTKLISVEGNIGSGKSEFAAELAKRLEFHYVPAPRMDEVACKNGYGMDMRQYYHLFPERYQIFDEEMFHEAPKHRNVNIYAFLQYALKFEAYCNALAHILNTGQGVVIEQSPFSNIAYVEAMYNKDFLSDAFAEWYPKFTLLTEQELKLYPHLYIYLDTPVSKCLENVKKRAIPHECNGKVIDYEYLSDVEKHLKHFLEGERSTGEVLSFDWAEPGNMDFVLDDIYKVDFSLDNYKSDKFDSWNKITLDTGWNDLRQVYTEKTKYALYRFNWQWWEVQELLPNKDEKTQMRYVMDNIVGKYCEGFNLSRGDPLMRVLFPRNYGSLARNKVWSEWTLIDNLWSFQPESWFYIEYPMLPSLTAEHFAPRKFNVADLAHAHH